MRLGQLVDGVRVMKLYQAAYGKHPVTQDLEVRALRYDSRKVGPGDCFVALRGSGFDGHRFVQEALCRGATVIVVDRDDALNDTLAMHHGVTKIVVADTRRALAWCAANFFDHPSRKLRMVGITGTNGKTTTAYLIRSVLESSGATAGLIGTVEYLLNKTSLTATHTTPESLELQELLASMVSAGCTSVSMEVSSHALHQRRVEGIDFAAAVFTNLTQDHLDYHGSMEEYFRAKKLLFESLSDTAPAVVNADDPWGQALLEELPRPAVSFGYLSGSTVTIDNAVSSLEGTSVTVTVDGAKLQLRSPLVGEFNVHNIVAAFSLGYALGIPSDKVLKGIERIAAVRGRFERIRSARGWTAIVDYAHTPDALSSCLRTIRQLLPKGKPGRIITVFGAGGDRDRAKRPMMGSVAAALSDAVILTSDNPRSEDPITIINEIAAGIPQGLAYAVEPDRKRAIVQALEAARAGDVVLVAGKGHEDYQVIRAERLHFNDREVIEEYL
jgi:UDP-N-acetylmuramoyl-L-alanyl-D-glutamate--2,6-diaminopimelate ligase